MSWHSSLGACRRVAAVVVLWAGLTSPTWATDAPAAPAVAPLAKSAPTTNTFENSLGMKFVPVPSTRVMACVWETRLKDYQVFREATARPWTSPAFAQADTHPVVNVNWEDAKAFCDWLTARERKDGVLTGQQRYRLPTDQEWSAAAGLQVEHGRTPEDRMKTQVVWPWGHYWPPQPGDGNYGPELKVDRFEHTAPVGSSKPNGLGLFDMGGNVWEWCDDWYNDARVTRALRGGSFNDAQPGYLLAAYRFSATMNLSGEDIGFRVVLESPAP